MHGLSNKPYLCVGIALYGIIIIRYMSLRHCCGPRTDIGFYDFAVVRQRAPTRTVPEVHEFFDERVSDAIRTDDDARLEATPRHITPADVELTSHRLGNGKTSSAYLCRLRFAPRQTFVVKVPNSVAEKVTEYVSDERPGVLPSSLRVDNPRVFDEYKQELHTMERLLEPDDYVKHMRLLGRNSLTHAEVRRFFLEREALRMHKGYAHIHHIVHVEYGLQSGYPMFFSDPCDGTVKSLRETGTYPDSDAPAWRELARQTLCGFDYMLSRRVMNTDLHDANIFYKRRGSHAYQYVIGDFGGFLYELDAVNPWTGHNNIQVRYGLYDLCQNVLNRPFHFKWKALKEPYRTVMTPLLGPVGFVENGNGIRAKQLYDEFVQVAAPEPMVAAPAPV